MISDKLDLIKTSSEMFDFVRNNDIIYWGVEYQNEDLIVYDVVFEEDNVIVNKKVKVKKSF
jgi:hypothetical protein|nr:MAG TPA: hypothetical protein [Caudoviricetes sp.]